ncbi:hypothetical protein GDO78_012720 [Eleutherodactylus coqui]|uniref:Uncharacterized protein n=1 Tax=Eleutherodactylus coqui TaxID=57060 RepID=A0A8J6F1Q1_ELECQ|nr:hypothetical protein GDO78_012720 [Eleutherodactylus coqui]
MIKENKTLEILNIESNFISSAGMLAVIKAMKANATVTELKVDNQVKFYSLGSQGSSKTQRIFEAPHTKACPIRGRMDLIP